MTLHREILSTLCFYDAVGGVALTKLELYKYLMRPAADKRGLFADTPIYESFYDMLTALEEPSCQNNDRISLKRGFYFLPKNQNGYERRIHTGKTGIRNWRTANKMAKIISFLPYVKMIAVTGSLSMDSTTDKSDIDLLIVARNGRIWTTRVIITAVMHLLGKRRHGDTIRGRICLNHYITDNSLTIRPSNLFSAHIILSLVPLYSNRFLERHFGNENIGFCSSYMPNGRTKTLNLRHVHAKDRNGYKIDKVARYILNNLALLMPDALQEIIEKFLKNIQIKKISRSLKSAPRMQVSDIIYGDSALVFHHPRPKDQEALYLYQNNLREAGIS